MKEDTKTFIFTALPVIIAAFFTIAVTLISENKWITALVQIPAWLALIWWVYALRNYYVLLDS